MCFTCPSIALAVSCACAFASPCSVDPTEGDAALREYLKHFASATTDMEFRLKVDDLGFAEISPDQWESASVVNQNVRTSFEVLWATDGVRSSSRVYVNIGNHADDTLRFVQVWNGSQYYQCTRKEDRAQHVIRAKPLRDTNLDFVSLFVGGHDWWSFVGPLALSRLLDTYSLEAVTTSGDRTTYDYALSGTPDAAHVKITIASEPTVRLVSIESSTFEADDATGSIRPRGRKLLRFLEWSQDAIPTAGVFMDGSLRLEPYSVLIHRIVCTQQSPITTGDSHLAYCPTRPGDNVVDESVGVQYVIGDRELVLADTSLMLDEPISKILTVSDLLKLKGAEVIPSADPK